MKEHKGMPKELMDNAPRGVSKYDWDKLLDGGTYELKRGEDFTTDVMKFRSQARVQARRRNLEFVARVDPEHQDTVWIQAHKKDKKPKVVENLDSNES